MMHSFSYSWAIPKPSATYTHITSSVLLDSMDVVLHYWPNMYSVCVAEVNPDRTLLRDIDISDRLQDFLKQLEKAVTFAGYLQIYVDNPILKYFEFDVQKLGYYVEYGALLFCKDLTISQRRSSYKRNIEVNKAKKLGITFLEKEDIDHG